MRSERINTYSNYLRLFEQVHGYAIIMMDTEGYIQDWNNGAEKIKGYSREEILGENFRRFYTKKDRENGKPDRLLNIAAEKGYAYDEGWRVRKDGSRFWGSITITAMYDEMNELRGYGKVTRDLTEKKAVEEELRMQARELRAKNEELRKKEMRFRHMMEEVQDYAIILMDTEGIIQNWNKGARKIKRYRGEEIIGKSFRLFYTEEDRQKGKPDRLLGIARETGRAQDEGWRVRKDGTKFWGSITITAIHDDDGNLIGYSKVTRDLSERKAADDARKQYLEQLELKNAELERFASYVSHDLREPLHTIHSFIHHLQKSPGAQLDAEATEYLRIISDASDRMKLFVKDLLDYSRLGYDRELSKVDMRSLVKDACDDLSTVLTESGAQVSVGELPVLMGYETELHVLIQNLLSNSIKFRREDIPPRISISAVSEDGEWKFAVQDNGIGVEESDQEGIFRIFKRIHSSSQYSGTGIGLARCQKIIELHSGRIWVESNPEKGSTFFFTIPEVEIPEG